MIKLQYISRRSTLCSLALHCTSPFHELHLSALYAAPRQAAVEHGEGAPANIVSLEKQRDVMVKRYT